MKKVEWRIKAIQTAKAVLSIFLAFILYKNHVPAIVWGIYLLMLCIEIIYCLGIALPIIKTEHSLDKLSRGLDEIGENQDVELDKK